jgi:hypothetical protein
MARIIGNTTATPTPVSDWNQTDANKADYIKNKPSIPSNMSDLNNDVGYISTVDAELSNSSANPVQNKVVYDAIENLARLIGETSVAEQLTQALSQIMPKITTITLPASGWTGEASPWSQIVTINSATANSKIDLQPTAEQIDEMQDSDVALMAENDNGMVTVYALYSKPTVDYTMQALITEVLEV